MQGQFDKLQAGLHVTVSPAIAVESLITVIIQMIAKAISGFQCFLLPFMGLNDWAKPTVRNKKIAAPIHTESQLYMEDT